MRTELIHDLLRYLDWDDSLQIDHCPVDVNRTLEEMPLPIDLKRLLQWYWPNQPGKIGPYYIDFYAASELIEMRKEIEFGSDERR